MDRASVFGTEGWGFESLRVHLFSRFSGTSTVLRQNPGQQKGQHVGRWVDGALLLDDMKTIRRLDSSLRVSWSASLSLRCRRARIRPPDNALIPHLMAAKGRVTERARLRARMRRYQALRLGVDRGERPLPRLHDPLFARDSQIKLVVGASGRMVVNSELGMFRVLRRIVVEVF
jgi:hypothetical protein